LLGVLALLYLLAAPADSGAAVRVAGADVDQAGLQRGIEARVSSLEGWSVTVSPGEADDRVYVDLRRPDGSQEGRELPALGETPEDRARGLAAELAYLIDQWEPPRDRVTNEHPDDPSGPEPAELSTRRGHVVVGGRVAVARSSVVAPGLGLHGGGWLFDEHLMLRGGFEWTTAARDDLRLHGLRPSIGIGAGAALLDRRLWVGGLLCPGVDVLIADDRRRRTVVGFGGAMTAVAQGRLLPSGRLLLELQTGLDLRLPPVRIQGQAATLRWRTAAWVSAISIGVAL